MQTALYTLFLPSSWKATPSPAPVDGTKPTPKEKDSILEEYIQGGQLYAECKIIPLPEGGEHSLGGEEVGRTVWEGLESGLEAWKREEERRKAREAKESKKSESEPKE
jgi:hypothetical protein